MKQSQASFLHLYDSCECILCILNNKKFERESLIFRRFETSKRMPVWMLKKEKIYVVGKQFCGFQKSWKQKNGKALKGLKKEKIEELRMKNNI